MKYLTLFLAVLILFSCNTDNPESVEVYQYDELIQKKSSELRIIRNKIFARHGYIFKSKDLAEYFGEKNWYEPKYNNVDSSLTVDEKKYIQEILKAENYVNQLERFKNYLTQSPRPTIGKVELPMKLEFFIETFGKPDSTFIDPNDFCAVGQFHYWNIEEENFRFIVLGDEYGEPVNFETKTRLVIFQRISKEKPSSLLTFNNIQLNDTEEIVKKEIYNFISSQPDFELDIFKNPTIVDQFITENLGKVYCLTNNNVYFYFVLDKNGRLEYIIEASFNIRMAC